MRQEVIGPVLGMIVSFVAQVVLLGQLRRHRIDGSLGERYGGYRGQSMRTLDPSNYDSAGRRLVPWMWVLILLWLACLVLLILVLSWPSEAALRSIQLAP